MPWLAIAAAAGPPRAPARRRERAPRWSVALAALVPLAVAWLILPCASVAREHPGPDAGARATAARSAATGRAHDASVPRSASDPFTAGLRRWLGGRGGDVTAAVEDLHSGRTWVYRADHPEHTASIVKVQILATLLHQRQNDGGLSEDQRELATGMIESSDDDDATDLWNGVGGASAVQAFDDSAGLTHTHANAAWGLTTTTPSDQLRLMHEVLLRSPLLTRGSRGYAYGLMTHIIPFDTWGVTSGPRGHATVAFKNGWLPYQGSWQVNSIGDVSGAGRHYLIAVMTDGSPTEAYGIATIERVAATTWADVDDGG